jgi:hypothetical protein
MDVAPAKPRVGQPVELVVRVTERGGGAPRKPIEEPIFLIGGPAMGGGVGAKLPAQADGNGTFRASFTFLSPGKYEVAFNARSDGALVKTARVLVAEDSSAQPPPQPQPPIETPPPAPSASVKWL